MESRDFLFRFINSLSGIQSQCRILQIGPGHHTYEISANADSEVRAQNEQTRASSRAGFRCSTCLFRVECHKGREIVNDRFPYEKCLFDKIILHAKADLKNNDLLDEAVRMLKVDGQIIVLTSNGNGIQDETLRNFCFRSNEIIERLSAHCLAIRSASLFRLSSSAAMCLTAGKYREVMQ